MFYRILFQFSFFLSVFTTLGQSSEALSQMLFPTDDKLQKTIQLIDDHFDFKKKGAFWELTALSNNRKESNKERIRVNPKGKIDEYDVELTLDYMGNFDYYKIETIDIKGDKIPLFGKHGAEEQLDAIDNHLSLLYQANENGSISRILIKELKAIAELTYRNGNLVRFRLTTKDYWGEPQRFIKYFADAKSAEACAKSFIPLSLDSTINLTSYESTCIAFCDSASKRNPFTMYGNFVFIGPIKNGVPNGEGFWAISNPCHGDVNKKYSGSVQHGTFTKGIATGWHTVDKDSVIMEYYYQDGVITAVKGAPIKLPFNSLGYIDSKVDNGVYHDSEASIRTGKNNITNVHTIQGQIKPVSTLMTYYDKNGSRVELHLDQTGEKVLKTIRQSPNGKMTATEYFSMDGEQLTNRTQLKVEYFDLSRPDLMPQSILVEGEVMFDLVNEKWGGENLKITFPEKENLILTGSFIPAYFYGISAAPTGKHVLQETSSTLTATYEDGRYVSGDEIYKLKKDYSSLPMSINFNRETNPTAFFSYENEITVQLPPKAYGIAFERPVVNDKGCKFEFSFLKPDGKQVHWFEKSLDGGEIISFDFNNAIGPGKKETFNYNEVKVRRKDCKSEFIHVYLYE